MNLHVCKLTTGETIIGELVEESSKALTFSFPYTIHQQPTVTENGYTELLLMLPFQYKYIDTNGEVEIKKKHILCNPTEANDTFVKLYRIYFIKQTVTDLRQEEAITSMYEEVNAKLQQTHTPEDGRMIH